MHHVTGIELSINSKTVLHVSREHSRITNIKQTTFIVTRWNETRNPEKQKHFETDFVARRHNEIPLFSSAKKVINYSLKCVVCSSCFYQHTHTYVSVNECGLGLHSIWIYEGKNIFAYLSLRHKLELYLPTWYILSHASNTFINYLVLIFFLEFPTSN